MTENHTVVVAGGTSGIGRSIAIRFAAEGSRVVIVGRNAQRGEAAARACEQAGGRGLFVPCDLAQTNSVATLAEHTLEVFGTPHVLVNSAGLLQSGTRVLAQDLEENEKLWRINYRGTLVTCQVFGRLMKEAGRGAILNLGSLASFAPISLPAYTPGKQAVLALTQILAAELGQYGIRVNSIAPGYTMSDGLKEKIAAGERDPEAIKSSTALHRFVDPEEIAEAALFLCSEKAKSITGVTLPIDAGWLVKAPYTSYLQGNPIRN